MLVSCFFCVCVIFNLVQKSTTTAVSLRLIGMLNGVIYLSIDIDIYLYIYSGKKSKIVLIVDDWGKNVRKKFVIWSKGLRALSGKVGLSLCNIYFIIKIAERTVHSCNHKSWFKLSKCQVKKTYKHPCPTIYLLYVLHSLISLLRSLQC